MAAKWSSRLYLFFSWGGVVFAAALLCITTFRLIPASLREQAHQKERILSLEKELRQVEHKVAIKRKFLDKLNTNSAFLERIARERLQYVRPDDIVIHVED